MYTLKITKINHNYHAIYIKEINLSFETAISLEEAEIEITKDELLKFVKDANIAQYERIEKLIMQKEKLVNIDYHTKEYWGPTYTICFHISRSCNLACKYCFGSEEYLPSEISIETIKKSIDYFVFDYGKNAWRYIIELSGSGEPLIRLDLIKEIEEYVEPIRKKLGKDILIAFCTNGTMINKEIAAYLKSKNRFLLGVSIDGNEKHSRNRIYKNGKETFYSVINGIKELEPKPVGFAVTISNQNEEVDEIFEYLANIPNCDCISMQNVRNYSLKDQSSYEINIKNVIYHYEILLDKIIQQVSESNFDYLTKLLKGSDYLGKYIFRVLSEGILFQYRCDGGKNRIAVDEKGKFYSCSVMNGCDEFEFGNIKDGVDLNKTKQHVYAVDKTPNNCCSCWAAYICSGECNARAYYANKDKYKNEEENCEFRKLLIELAIKFVNRLRIECKAEYNQILRIRNEIANFDYADIGIWAICQILNNHNIDYEYSKLVQKADKTDKGVSPKQIITILNSYIKKEFTLVHIKEHEEKTLLSYPSIAVVPNSSAGMYGYCIILGENSDESFNVRFINNDKKIKIFKKKFFSDVSRYFISV